MARNYASIKVSIWADDDFRKLSPTAQHLYFVLLTSVDLELTGVTDWRPKRVAKLAAGWTEAGVRKAAAELEAARYVLFDEETEQALVRTFIRHDGVLKNPKTAIGMVAKWGPIESIRLKATIAETARDAQRDGLSDGVASIIAALLDYQPDYQSDTQPDQVADSPAPCYLLPDTGNPASDDDAEPRPTKYPAAFEDWWQHYPAKKDKAEALKAWKVQRSKIDHATLVAATIAYAEGRDVQRGYAKNGATWLRRECWLDAVEPKGDPRANNTFRVVGGTEWE